MCLFFLPDLREGIRGDGSRITSPFTSWCRESARPFYRATTGLIPEYLNHSLELRESMYGSRSPLPAHCEVPGYAWAVLPSELLHVVHSLLSLSVSLLSHPANFRLGEFRDVAKWGRTNYRRWECLEPERFNHVRVDAIFSVLLWV